MSQATDHVFLIRPQSFGFNPETALSNTFQNKLQFDPTVLQEKVSQEFKAFAQTLIDHGVHVTIFEDTPVPVKPDAVFPNNWISCHEDGTLVLYPMCTPNRRAERRADIVETLKKNFAVTRTIDLTHYESENRFLEGTGSIIFDHVHRLAYACESPRTDHHLFLEVCGLLRHKPVFFHAENEKGIAIYHTNVMMCVGDSFAVICLDSIRDEREKAMVENELKQGNHDIITISLAQMNSFAGNMLLLEGKNGNLLALSQCAFDSLTLSQRLQLEKHTRLLPLSIPTIEGIGGGSARCMIAEVRFPKIQ